MSTRTRSYGRPRANSGDDENAQEQHKKNCAAAVTAIAIVAFAMSIGAIILGANAWNTGTNLTAAKLYSTSKRIHTDDYVIIISSSAAQIRLSLPNDLTPYIGKRFDVFSKTAQPHTIEIEGGTSSSTWDGSNTVATFGGGVGDGVSFRVISKNRVVISPPTNVAFN